MRTIQGSTARDTADAPDVNPPVSRARWGRRLAAGATVVVGIAVSGIALAAWNVTGSGFGAATADSSVELIIEDFELDTALYPGLTTAATLTVSNPNPFPVRLIDIEFGAIVITGAGAGCTDLTSAVTFTDVTGGSLFLAAATTDIELTLSGVATMGPGSDTDCQNATFTAPITLTAESTTTP